MQSNYVKLQNESQIKPLYEIETTTVLTYSLQQLCLKTTSFGENEISHFMINKKIECVNCLDLLQ